MSGKVGVAGSFGEVRRGQDVLGECLRVGAMGDQEVAQPGKPVLGGRVERGVAAVLGLVWIGTTLDEQPGDGVVAGRDRAMEWLDPEAARSPGGRIGAPIEELLDGP